MVYVAGASLALGVGLFVVALGRRPGRRAVRRPGPANRMCVLAFVFARAGGRSDAPGPDGHDRVGVVGRRHDNLHAHAARGRGRSGSC